MLIGWGSYTQAQTLTFSLSNETGSPGDTLVIAVLVDSFTNMSGYQGTFRWDSAQLSYISMTNGYQGLNHFMGNPGQGIIPLDAATFSWLDFSGAGVSVPDSSNILNLTFEVKASANPGSYPVLMDGSITALGFTDGGNIQPPIVNQGSATIITCFPTADPSFNLPVSVCQSGSNPQATIIGDVGGAFSVDQGATIDTTTGVLDLSSTIPGTTYTITYAVGSPCQAFASQSIQVLGPDDATFLFPDTACISGSNPVANVIGLLGGNFTVDQGASIDSNSGTLDLSSVSAGTNYTITYATNGPCPNTFTQAIYITIPEDAGFTLADTVCFSGFNPIPTITGVAGGSFSVDQGATVDALTGELLLSTTASGTTYTLTYQSPGPCAGISSQSIYIAPLGDAGFAFPDTVCPGGPNPVAIITGSTGGQFSVSPTATINAATGELDLGSVSQGVVYTITYSLNDACQTIENRQIEIGDFGAPDSVSLPDLFGECSVSAPVPSTTDACAGTVLGITTDAVNFSQQGTYSITWTFDDGNGNQRTAVQNVMVMDTIAPLVQCKNIAVQLDSAGLAVIDATMLDDGSSDPCGIDSVFISQQTFDTTNVGDNTVILTVVDVNGNSNSCEAIVSVEANTTPIDEEILRSLKLAAHPNPTYDQVQVSWESPWYGAVKLSVINQIGQVLYQQSLVKQGANMQTKLSLGNLPAGFYLIQMQQEGYQQYVRLIKR